MSFYTLKWHWNWAKWYKMKSIFQIKKLKKMLNSIFFYYIGEIIILRLIPKAVRPKYSRSMLNMLWFWTISVNQITSIKHLMVTYFTSYVFPLYTYTHIYMRDMEMVDCSVNFGWNWWCYAWRVTHSWNNLIRFQRFDLHCTSSSELS